MSENCTHSARSSRVMPLRMAEKLRQIRISLGLSQKGIAARLVYKDISISRSSISVYERGKREPPLVITYAYAKLANVSMEVLADDALDLPDIIPETKFR